ncbi:uncharacterized protein LOC125492872 [Beta vulgaris subsp. vulgaris]|uniref:uncharacterized protein LOC125492872 n=1 Tax=Beta vulgaris subsp. vulgaris TaxID=3555 RepID=UPI00053F48D2|nr:uncharacterized protein LOC125492872 [Beta vulgaris subsp. vulgaris]
MHFGELHKKDPKGLVLKSVDAEEYLMLMAEIHQGLCGAHQNGLKMRWLLHEHGFYWHTMRNDCIDYAKSYKRCQKFVPISTVPASELKYILKPWSFGVWEVDVIGEINPESSKKHSYIVVVTNYFTKWVEAQAFKKINTQVVINFLEEKIFTIRSQYSETLTCWTILINIGLLIKMHSTPYYAQANVNVRSSKVVQQMVFSGDDYSQAMNIEVMDALEAKEEALAKMRIQKETIARAYNKKVVAKDFQENDKV